MFKKHKCTHGSINEYTYENGVRFEIKCLQSLRLSSLIAPEDDTLRPEFYHECDWIIVIGKQTKNYLSEKRKLLL